MPTAYEKDVVLWSEEQAHYLRSGQFDKLDLENLAEEVLDVDKSELRELESRMAVLLAHLIKWAWQPSHRSRSWERTIKDQRLHITRRLKKTPSLVYKMADENEGFWFGAWSDGVQFAHKETGIPMDIFPEAMPWSEELVLTEGWLPDSAV